MGCSGSNSVEQQDEIISNSIIEKSEYEYGFEDSDHEDLIIDYSDNLDFKNDDDDKDNENKKEIEIDLKHFESGNEQETLENIKQLESVDEQEILDSVNNENKDGGFDYVDPVTQRKYLNSLCYKNQKKWLHPDSFYSECCSNVKEVIDKHINDEQKQQYLLNVVTSLQNKKSCPKSKTHKKCKLIQEKISKTKSFSSKIFDLMVNCIHKMLVKFLRAFLRLLYSMAVTQQHITITVLEIYHMIQSLPILRHIMPKKIGDGSVLPPKEGFSNWALTVQYKTDYMPFLKNVDDVRSFITKCNDDKKQCRFVSYGHSFSPMFGDNGTYTGKIIDSKYTGMTPPLDAFSNVKYENNYSKIIVDDRPLMYIELLPDNQIYVGGATSNYLFSKFQRFRYFEKGHLLTASEPCNVLQHFQGYGGTHAVGCHGAGINTTNLPYYIRELKILDAFGKEHIYDQENDLKIISTHFGLLGFVTEMKLQYEKPYFALFQPKNMKFEEYFPRNGECKQFQDDVNNSYYNEFFWYPTQKNVFINVWKRTYENDNPNEVEIYPNEKDVLVHKTSATIMQTFNTLFPIAHYNGLYAKIFQSIVGSFSQSHMPTYDKPKKILPCDALHFLWGIQELRVLDMEWSIPLKSLKKEGKPVLVDGKTVPDCSLVRDLIWACKDLVQEYHKKDCYPQILPLELRILRGNDRNLNCGSGVEFTCAIEVLSIVGTNDANKTFYKYCQELTDKWAKIAGDDAQFMRPHWGKLWQDFTVLGKPIRDHLKATYGDQWKELEKYRLKHDPNGIFLNDSFREILNL